jgi:hypothetical protein
VQLRRARLARVRGDMHRAKKQDSFSERLKILLEFVPVRRTGSYRQKI